MTDQMQHSEAAAPLAGPRSPSADSLDTSPHAVSAVMALSNTDGFLMYLDPRILKLLALPKAKAKSLNLRDLLANPQDYAAILETLQAHRAVQDFPSALVRAGGEILPVTLSVNPIQLGGKTHLFLVLRSFHSHSGQDPQSELCYRLLWNSVPVGVTVTDGDGRFYAFNPAFCGMTGYTQEQLYTMSAQALYQNGADRLDCLKALARGNPVRNFETTLLRQDGAAIRVLQNTDIVDFGDLQNVLLTTTRDISPLKRAEDALERERGLAQAVLDASDAPILAISPQGRVVKHNRAFAGTFGYSPAELHELTFWDLLSPDGGETRARIERLATPQAMDTLVCSLLAKDGRVLPLQCAVYALTEEAGPGFLVVAGSGEAADRDVRQAAHSAHLALEQNLLRLEAHNRIISRLAEMENVLQGCRTVAESCAVFARFVQSLCPETSGAVYLTAASGETAQIGERWGDLTHLAESFAPTDCWSVRRGKPNLIDSANRGLPCPHIRMLPGGQYLCIPLEANGEMLGILHMVHLAAPDSAPYFEAHLPLLGDAAEAAALSLANIMTQDVLRQQSIRDVLTGIYNRRYMVESLQRELSRAKRDHTAVSVLMFDIDYFKAFNDTYGHDGGDLLLRQLGDFLRQNTRGEDIVCRYSGEEFVVVLPNTDPVYAMQKADMLRSGVTRLQIPHLGSLMRPCTISAGVAAYPKNGQTPDELLKAADDALYAAKRQGRNRVVESEVASKAG